MANELHLPHIPAGDHPLGKWVAIFTAIVATMGGIVGREASHIANEAILYKNQAVLKKSAAAFQDRGLYRPSERPASPTKVVRFLLKLKGKHVPVPDGESGE